MFILTSISSYAQQNIDKNKDKKAEFIESIIEANAEITTDEDEDLSTYFDELYHYYDHPINLNRTNQDELRNLGILNDYQINNLLTHIEKNGRLLTIYEIQAIEGFDLKIIYDILPFIKVTDNFDSPNITIKEMFKNGNTEVFLRDIRTLEEQVGYSEIEDSLLAENPNSRYLGTRDQIYFKYRFKYGSNVSWGLVGRKDKGEELFQGTQPQGFDFYSAHFFLKDIGKIKELALGDYQIQIGQGLTFWTGRSTRFSAYTLDVKRNPRSVKPYTSSAQYGFLRGAAANVKLGKFEVLGFYSRKNIDASLDTSNVDIADELGGEDVTFGSFTIGGYHRTPSEVAKKNTVGETIFGSQVLFKQKRFQLGASAVQMMWDANFQANLKTYNQFEFNSNKNLNLGVNYNYVVRNFNFFGEAARSSSGGTAFVSGSLITLDPRLTMAVVYRNYSRDYHVMYRLMYGNGIGNATRTSNEKGLYLGLEAKPVKQFIINAYFDRYEYPWLSYGVTAPSQGNQYLVQATFKPNKKFETYVRYRQRNKEINGNIYLFDNVNDGVSAVYNFSSVGIDPIVSGKFNQYRWHITYKMNDALTLKNRVEFNTYQEEGEDQTMGYMMYQDIVYKPLGKKYQLSLRYTMFDVENFLNSIYLFENTVLYGPPTIGLYGGRGNRYYILLRYRITRNIDFWVKFAQTYYADKKIIGSGLEQINGNTRSDIIGQLRIKF